MSNAHQAENAQIQFKVHLRNQNDANEAHASDLQRIDPEDLKMKIGSKKELVRLLE